MYTKSLIEIMTYKVLVIVITSVIYRIISSASIIQVGEIFDGSNQNKELAFEVAIDMVNKQHRIPRKILKPVTERIHSEEIINAKLGTVVDMTWNNPYDAFEVTCSILKEGVVGIFNLLTGDNSDTVKSVCDAKEIPVIQTTLDHEHQKECCIINLFPHPPVLVRAFIDVIKRWGWKQFTFIYEDSRSLPNIAEILKAFDAKYYNIVIRQLHLNENGNYMSDLKSIRKSDQQKFVLDCSSESLNQILIQAQQVGLMMDDYSYIILNLDFQIVDLFAFQYSGTNITGFRLFDPLNFEIIEVAEALANKKGKSDYQGGTYSPFNEAWKLQTDIILLIDAVMLFADVLKDHTHFKARPLFCNSSDNWEHGSTMFNFMKTKTMVGLSGKIDFDHRGFRTDFFLEIIELSESGISKIGTWNINEGLFMFKDHSSTQSFEGDSLANMTFNVMIAENHPYMMYKGTSTRLHGNDQYEGFAIDIIQELARMEGFNYTFIRTENDTNGSYNSKTKTWDGMIGDVLSKKGDLAIGDLTITREREEFVDFTSPFMFLGIQILYTKPTKSTPGFFSFATPFGTDVWAFIVITFFIMSLTFYLVARICPYEWFNPFPCLDRPRYFLNQYTFGNCMWLITGTLLQEGSDVAPRGISTRVLSSFWAFFILILANAYTANMAAFLTAEKEVWPFTDVRELVERADKLGIGYGAVINGSTHKFFQESGDETYRKIAAYMNSHPEFMVPWYELGVDIVEDPKQKYAFFMESSSIKYVTERVCNLTSVGYFLDEKYYGIAMRKDSSYRNRLSAAVLKLNEMGIIDELERKWWQQRRGGGQCSKIPFTSAPPLSYKHISGVIWLTFGGIGVAFIIVVMEVTLKVVRKHKKCKERIQELRKELRLCTNFEANVKPATKNIAAVKSDPITDT